MATERLTSASVEYSPLAPGSIPPCPGSMIRVLICAFCASPFFPEKERSNMKTLTENKKRRTRFIIGLLIFNRVTRIFTNCLGMNDLHLSQHYERAAQN